MLTTLTVCACGDSLLKTVFCQKYFPRTINNPDCELVASQVLANHSRPLPTLELGDPSKPALFFIHGWPDSAAVWAAQFAHFCYDGSYYCVAATWANFHPDFLDAPDRELTFVSQMAKLAATMRETKMRDTTLVIHDWGAFLGYQMMYRYPELVRRTVAFDIGFTCDNCTTNTTYQDVNREAWATHDSMKSESSAEYFSAPCVDCAVWRTTWPYVYPLSSRNFTPAADLGPVKPLMFLWGNETAKGLPRRANTLFFGQSWLDQVNRMPYGKTVEVPSDHWLSFRAAEFVNRAVDDWLRSLPAVSVKTWEADEGQGFVGRPLKELRQAFQAAFLTGYISVDFPGGPMKRRAPDEMRLIVNAAGSSEESTVERVWGYYGD
ncbi:hypothetical protein CYMTET_37767 [Cymbomonas tetramitiformis]|uniref:AB hydrolase-1 domain-containing protein n=1 Tax=Cymbomonas tetramitiformis TaxID=36881 RepID=A0AAE0CET0_9CHLO|nr:hypothetical protein CYMTET_37767 [Cymbomonas tetramitiformis]